MSKSLKIFLPSDIEVQKDIIIHNNAFILPDGCFVLAKGYTGCNPSHQLESSALQIARNLTDGDIKKEYEDYIEKSGSKHSLYYLRTMLVHYYGLALFARVENIQAFNDRNKFSDYSIIPNPKYYGKGATSEQISTLKELFAINDDGTLLNNSSEEVFQKVLTFKNMPDNWHRIF